MSGVPERSKYASRETTAENFWARVDKTGDCWVWTERLDDKGYGHVARIVSGILPRYAKGHR